VALVRTDNSEEHIAANVVPSTLILFALIMEVIRSFETSVLIRTTRDHIPEHCILQLHLLILIQTS
jgi:PleD family two-component response regulator